MSGLFPAVQLLWGGLAVQLLTGVCLSELQALQPPWTACKAQTKGCSQGTCAHCLRSPRILPVHQIQGLRARWVLALCVQRRGGFDPVCSMKAWQVHPPHRTCCQAYQVLQLLFCVQPLVKNCSICIVRVIEQLQRIAGATSVCEPLLVRLKAKEPVRCQLLLLRAGM